METATEKSRYELFKENAEADIRAHQDRLMGDGTFDYVAQVTQLEKLSINISGRMMTHLFGEQLGEHLAVKFNVECRGNLLYFLRALTSEYKFFILYELKTNKNLFANS